MVKNGGLGEMRRKRVEKFGLNFIRDGPTSWFLLEEETLQKIGNQPTKSWGGGVGHLRQFFRRATTCAQ